MRKQNRPDIVARADEAFGSSNYAEYSVDKKKEGKYKTQRFLMILAYAGVFALVVGIVALINKLTDGATGMFGVFMFALAPLALWMMIFFTWKYVSIEYKYVIDHAEFTAYTVYGGKKENKVFSCRMKDFRLIAPYNDQYKSEIDTYADAVKIDVTPSMNANDIYAGVAEDEYGKRTVVFFQATSHSLKALKYYNKDALVMSDTLK